MWAYQRYLKTFLLVPLTLALRFDLAIKPDTADKRYCFNSKMKVKLAGECLLDLNRYDLYNTYKDLFKWPKDRNELEGGYLWRSY